MSEEVSGRTKKTKEQTMRKLTQNSRSGPTFTELIDIIKVCGDNAVTSIVFPSGAKIDFAPVAKKYQAIPNGWVDLEKKSEDLDKEILEIDEEIDDNNEDEKDSARAREEGMVDLMLTNPEAYEQVHINGDING